MVRTGLRLFAAHRHPPRRVDINDPRRTLEQRVECGTLLDRVKLGPADLAEQVLLVLQVEVDVVRSERL